MKRNHVRMMIGAVFILFGFGRLFDGKLIGLLYFLAGGYFLYKGLDPDGELRRKYWKAFVAMQKPKKK